MTADGHAADGRTPVTGRDRRIAWWAALRLDLWLEWYAVPPATGRAMRKELTANLLEAAHEPGGVRAAVRRVDVRDLAREAAVDTGAPRWNRGATAAVLALGLVLVGQGLLALVFADGLLSAGGGQGTLLGEEVSASQDGDGLEVAFGIGPGPVVAAVVVFVLVSRPWRAVRRPG